MASKNLVGLALLQEHNRAGLAMGPIVPFPELVGDN